MGSEAHISSSRKDSLEQLFDEYNRARDKINVQNEHFIEEFVEEYDNDPLTVARRLLARNQVHHCIQLALANGKPKLPESPSASARSKIENDEMRESPKSTESDCSHLDESELQANGNSNDLEDDQEELNIVNENKKVFIEVKEPEVNDKRNGRETAATLPECTSCRAMFDRVWSPFHTASDDESGFSSTVITQYDENEDDEDDTSLKAAIQAATIMTQSYSQVLGDIDRLNAMISPRKSPTAIGSAYTRINLQERRRYRQR